jgi:hypothetical protein
MQALLLLKVPLRYDEALTGGETLPLVKGKTTPNEKMAKDGKKRKKATRNLI